MTIQQFNELNEMEKVAVIMQSGRLLAQYLEDDSRIFLYRVDVFYVAATYCKSDDLLLEISSFMEIYPEISHYREQMILVNPAERAYETREG